jgi:hypothetical protein
MCPIVSMLNKRMLDIDEYEVVAARFRDARDVARAPSLTFMPEGHTCLPLAAP